MMGGGGTFRKSLTRKEQGRPQWNDSITGNILASTLKIQLNTIQIIL